MPPLMSVHKRLNRTCFPMYFVICFFFFFRLKKKKLFCVLKSIFENKNLLDNYV
jgi:hypothetical protein